MLGATETKDEKVSSDEEEEQEPPCKLLYPIGSLYLEMENFIFHFETIKFYSFYTIKSFRGYAECIPLL